MLDRKEEIWYFYAHQRYVIVENFFESYCDLCRFFGQLTWRSLWTTSTDYIPNRTRNNNKYRVKEWKKN